MAGHREPPRVLLILAMATTVIIVGEVLTALGKIPSEPGALAAYMAVLAAALAFPGLDKRRNGRGKDDDDEGQRQ